MKPAPPFCEPNTATQNSVDRANLPTWIYKFVKGHLLLCFLLNMVATIGPNSPGRKQTRALVLDIRTPPDRPEPNGSGLFTTPRGSIKDLLTLAWEDPVGPRSGAASMVSG